VSPGLGTESLSGYFPVHGGYSYDVRFVTAGSTNCATSLADSTYLAHSEPGGGGYTSVLLVGYETVPADAGVVPPYDAAVPEDAAVDAGDAGPQPVSVGISSLAESIVAIEDESLAAPETSALRVVHVAPDHPDPVAMSFVITGPLSWSIVNVPYGGFSTEPGPVDPWGYETMAAGTMSVGLDAFEGTYVMGSDQTTMFVVHGANGADEIIACDDYNESLFSTTNPTYTGCCVVGSTCPTGLTGGSGPGPTGGSGPQPPP
jgi:hypothetical protein